MSHLCDNCGQPILENDTVCWQCGRSLVDAEQLDESASQVRVKESWSSSKSMAATAVYAALTLLVIVGALVVMMVLGQRPLVQVGIGNRPVGEWQAVTDAATTFTLNLPEDWLILDGADDMQSAELRQLVDGDSVYWSGTYPFGNEVDDLEPLFWARHPNQDNIFVLVSRSQKLSVLSNQEAMRVLANGDYAVRIVEFVDNYDKSHVSIHAEAPVADTPFSYFYCRQQLIQGKSESMLVAGCVPSGLVGAYSVMLEQIMISFQRLVF